LRTGVPALLGIGLPKCQHFEPQTWAYRERRRAVLRAREAADPGRRRDLFCRGICRSYHWRGAGSALSGGVAAVRRERVRAGGVPLLVRVLEAGGAFCWAVGMVSRMDLTD
jgi:hypothetical protein